MTDKQKRFCEEYIIDFNAAQSAIRAGYSEPTARQKGYELLSNEEIKEYIEELKDDKSEELNITFEQLAKIELEIAMNGKREADRLKAVDQLSKKLGYYEQHNSQKKNITNINLRELIGFSD